MKAIILAAGYATRLYPLTKNIPKALLKINGKHLIDFILEKLRSLNLEEVYLITNKKFHKNFLEWGKGKDVKIINDGTEFEHDRLGAVGDMYFVVRNEKIEDDLLVINSDNIFEFDIKDFLEFFPGKPKLAFFNIKRKEEARNYGVIGLSKDIITKFEEKPEIPFSTKVSTGIYFFTRNETKLIKTYIMGGGEIDKTGDFIRWLINETDVYAYNTNGKWFDIGTKETFEEAKKAFE